MEPLYLILSMLSPSMLLPLEVEAGWSGVAERSGGVAGFGWREVEDRADRWAPLGSDRGEGCDRTTPKMRGLSPKIISGDSRRSENAQTHTNKHTIPNIKFKLKLLQIKCRVLGFTKVKAPKCASKELIRVLRKRLSLTIGTRSSP
jgi:hypothetical protein